MISEIIAGIILTCLSSVAASISASNLKSTEPTTSSIKLKSIECEVRKSAKESIADVFPVPRLPVKAMIFKIS